MSGTEWYVAYTKPRYELRVAKQLLERMFETYVPYIKTAFNVKEQPLFPCYLFFRPPDGVLPIFAKTACGIRRILGYRDGLKPLEDEVIQFIRSRVEQINSQGGYGIFQKGETVFIKSGPFEGLEGIFQGYVKSRDRVKILLHFMNRGNVPVYLPPSSIAKSGKIKLPRRTRGRGRFIRGFRPGEIGFEKYQ